MSVDFCNWCPDPHHPSAVHHPGGQCEHLAGDGITDDRAAIHARLDAGKFVVLPSGGFIEYAPVESSCPAGKWVVTVTDGPTFTMTIDDADVPVIRDL